MLSMSLENQERFIVNNKVAPGDLCRHVSEKGIKPFMPSDLTIEQIQETMNDLGIPVITQIVEVALRLAEYKKTKERIPTANERVLEWREFYRMEPKAKTELEMQILIKDFADIQVKNGELEQEVLRLKAKLKNALSKGKGK